MNLKKTKKLKRKYDDFQAGYNTTIGYHVYRSENLFAPFSEWERITEKPMSAQSTSFSDRYTEADEDKNYYYKTTRVDVFGRESAPENPERMQWLTKEGKVELNLATSIAGRNVVYWSADPDLPLDRWKLYNDVPITGADFVITAPVDGIYYIYAKNVNELGEEFGKPSEIQKLTPENTIERNGNIEIR